MSASPSASDADGPRNQEQITFRFCRECSNMLYPKEDRENNQLMYACRTCPFSEAAVTACVYRNQLTNTVGETAGVTQDVGADPTVGSTSLSDTSKEALPLNLMFDDFSLYAGMCFNFLNDFLGDELKSAPKSSFAIQQPASKKRTSASTVTSKNKISKRNKRQATQQRNELQTRIQRSCAAKIL